MHRPDTIYDFEDTINEVLTFEIGKAAQCNAAAEVTVLIGVTSGTAEWTLASNFN
jgi:hypothetical protein